MGRRYPKYLGRRIDKKLIGLLLFTIGIAIIAVITLPYTIWMVLLGCGLVYAGYKLFLC